MASVEARLKRAEGRLSPRQVVRAFIEEGRESGSFMEHARSIGECRVGSQTIMERVEQSVTTSQRGIKPEDKHRAIRRAQMEAMYLCRLHQQCLLAVVEPSQLWVTRAGACFAMLRAIGLEYELAELRPKRARSEQELAASSQLCIDLVSFHHAEVAAVAGAIAIIEREDFGYPVLYPWERRTLDEQLATASRLLKAVMPLARALAEASAHGVATRRQARRVRRAERHEGGQHDAASEIAESKTHGVAAEEADGGDRDVERDGVEDAGCQEQSDSFAVLDGAESEREGNPGQAGTTPVARRAAQMRRYCQALVLEEFGERGQAREVMMRLMGATRGDPDHGHF